MRRDAARSARGVLASLIACALLGASSAPATTGPTPTPNPADRVTVQVVNALSGLPLASLSVNARKRTGDSYSSFSTLPTDANGRATFTLTGLSTGVRFAFTATPYNGGLVQSADVVAGGTFRFAVGTMPVSVVAGGTNAALANVKVSLKEKRADGSVTSITSGTTNGSGLIIFDPPGLGSGRVFLLEAPSPWDGTTKRSNEIREAGGQTFVVGNAPLNVTVIDYHANTPLGALPVSAYERMADGTLQHRSQRTTDANGRVVFDLDKLGAGRVYVLRVKANNEMYTDSEDLRAGGEFLFRVGSLRAKVVDGATGQSIVGGTVTAYEKLPDGKLNWVKSGKTNENGVIRYDLPGLGQGRVYVLRAVSLTDGSTKTSFDITQPAKIVFTVGNAPLRVSVVDAVSQQALPGLSLTVSERMATGDLRWAASRTLDAAGRAVFDLDGLGGGRVYVLSVTPFSTGTVYSSDLSTAGDFTFAVGTLEVTVVNGADGVPLAVTDVSAIERLADGKTKWRAGGKTDARGVIRFDLPGLGAGRTYYLEAKSPWDGSTKRSDNLTQTGRVTFAVGRNPLRVRVVNGLSGNPLANLAVTAYRKPATGSLQWVAQRTTDPTGNVIFDLDGLGAGDTFVLVTTPYNGGTVYSDELREGGPFEFRVGTVKLVVAHPVDGSVLPDVKVTALLKNPDGTFTWTKSGTTDGSGMIRFDLPGLGSGKIYVFEAKGLVDGNTRRSQEITTLGKHVFTLGNKPLLVTLQNAINANTLAGFAITAWERLPSGERRWAAQRTTDANGQVAFDLEGLGSGRVYVLSAVPYTTGTVFSDDLTQTGPYTFRVGTLTVKVVSGATGAAMVDVKVTAYELVGADPIEWRASGKTNTAGTVRFDLPGLRDGSKRYVLEAKSVIDGGSRYSQPITAEGSVVFTVGNAPLRVALINGISGAPIPQVELTAYEELVNGEKRWARQVVTDAGGVAVFDLEGLGSGRRYRLQGKINGVWLTSDSIEMPGDVFFRVGTVPVTLIDGDNEVPLAGKKLVLYEKLPDGSRVWQAEITTDAAGVARFDLPGVSQSITRQQPPAPRDGDRIYAVRASNPFGNNKEYWSQLISREGPVLMRILRAVSQPLDVTPPTVGILSHADGASVDVAGFTLLGTATDNVRIDRVEATIRDAVRGSTGLSVSYDSARRQWTAAVAGALLTAGQPATVTVQAFDGAQNRATTAITLQVISDSAPPQVSFTSHQSNAQVPRSGFLLGGRATDDVGVVSLLVTIDDPVLGRTVSQTVGVAADGSFGLAVLSGQVSEGQTVTVTAVGLDAKGNQATASLLLRITGVDFLAHHLLNRITFGSTPALLATVEAGGVDAFLAQQLDPQSIDDSALAARLGPAATTRTELQRQALVRAMYSRRQLLEVLTAFWDNHFNTDVNKHNVIAYEVAENALFRARALGRFRDLLDASAKSPAMLLYLDQAASQRGMPNENYPRELMELHTLSVDGGYTQADVEQVARAFTGWTLVNGQFFFDAANHDTGQKVVLGQTLPAGRGIEDGEQVLDILAAHPSTARFICTKLSQLLVSDTPPAGLVDRCAAEYLNTNGLISAVVRIIVRSPEFADPATFRAKVRTPVETAVFWVRALDANSDATNLITPISDMGMRPFQNPVPTGWSETGDDWINSNLLLQRFKHANRLARNQIAGTTVNLRAFFTANQQATADGIVGFLLQQLYYSDFSVVDYETAVDVLTDGGTLPFSLNQPDAEARLQRMVGSVLSFPGSQYQ